MTPSFSLKNLVYKGLMTDFTIKAHGESVKQRSVKRDTLVLAHSYLFLKKQLHRAPIISITINKDRTVYRKLKRAGIVLCAQVSVA